MRTTIDIPDSLMKKAKMKSVEEGITLKKLFIRCLKSELERDERPLEEKLKELRKLGNADNLDPEESAFDLIYHEIDPVNQAMFVNEPSKDNDL